MTGAHAKNVPVSAVNRAAITSPIGAVIVNMHAPSYPGVDASIASTAIVLYLLSIVQVQ